MIYGSDERKKAKLKHILCLPLAALIFSAYLVVSKSVLRTFTSKSTFLDLTYRKESVFMLTESVQRVLYSRLRMELRLGRLVQYYELEGDRVR